VAPLIGKLAQHPWAQAFLALPSPRRLLILRVSAGCFGALVLVLLLVLVWPRNLPLVIRSEPDQAEVLRDGESLGTTPVLLELKRGTLVKLTVRKSGFEESAQEFTVGAEKVVLVTLEAASGGSKPGRGKKAPPKPADDGADDGGDGAGGDAGKGDGSDDAKKKKKKKKKKVVVF
jgi:hypothetical protein